MQVNNPPCLNPDEMKKVHTAIQYLERHFTESISGYHLSLEVELRPEKIVAGFRLLTGLSVHQYLCHYRVEQAKIELENFSLTVNQVGYKMGFSTASLFIQHFKAFVGQTPR